MNITSLKYNCEVRLNKKFHKSLKYRFRSFAYDELQVPSVLFFYLEFYTIVSIRHMFKKVCLIFFFFFSSSRKIELSKKKHLKIYYRLLFCRYLTIKGLNKKNKANFRFVRTYSFQKYQIYLFSKKLKGLGAHQSFKKWSKLNHLKNAF